MKLILISSLSFVLLTSNSFADSCDDFAAKRPELVRQHENAKEQIDLYIKLATLQSKPVDAYPLPDGKTVNLNTLKSSAAEEGQKLLAVFDGKIRDCRNAIAEAKSDEKNAAKQAEVLKVVGVLTGTIVPMAIIIPEIIGGPSNDIRKAIETIQNDLTKGPGNSNDVVGKDGWLRKRLGF